MYFVDLLRIELRILRCKRSVFPLALQTRWGGRRELNPHRQIHSLPPKPFGHVHIWSLRSESNRVIRFTRPAHRRQCFKGKLEPLSGYDPESYAYQAYALPSELQRLKIKVLPPSLFVCRHGTHQGTRGMKSESLRHSHRDHTGLIR